MASPARPYGLAGTQLREIIAITKEIDETLVLCESTLEQAEQLHTQDLTDLVMGTLFNNTLLKTTQINSKVKKLQFQLSIKIYRYLREVHSLRALQVLSTKNVVKRCKNSRADIDPRVKMAEHGDVVDALARQIADSVACSNQ